MSRADLSKAIRLMTKALGPYQGCNVFIDVRVYDHQAGTTQESDWEEVLDKEVGVNRVRVGVKRKAVQDG